MTSSLLRVLAYHRIIDSDGPVAQNPFVLSATPRAFEWQMRHLSRHYSVVSLQRVIDVQRGRATLPRAAVLLTFDDATRDFADAAWPIMRRYGLPATVFVPTAFPGDRQRSFWWERLSTALFSTASTAVRLEGVGTLPLLTTADRRAALGLIQRRMKTLPNDEVDPIVDDLCLRLHVRASSESSVLGWAELRTLAREGLTLAAHTREHSALTRLSPERAEDEVRGSLTDLERRIGRVPAAFCYPYGDHDQGVVEIVRRAGVDLGFTCLPGHNRLPTRDPLRLHRTSVTIRTSPPLFALRLREIGGMLDSLRTRHRGTAQGHVTPAQIPPRRPAVAYIMSRFPKLSETFVLNEIVRLESLGVSVEVFPLLRERQVVRHPEADRLVARARFEPFVSGKILRANWQFFSRSPVRYLRTALEALRGTWGSTNFFIGALGIFPKTVRFALRMQELGIEHVHAHFATHPALAALMVHRLTGIPYSFVAHGSDLHVDRTMLDVKVASASFVVAVSRYNRDVVLGECDAAARGKVHVIHCGVDTRLFRSVERKPDSAVFTVICVASFEEVKGHRFLLRACRSLLDRGIQLSLHLIGEGPLRREMTELISQLHLGQAVSLHGGQPRPAIVQMLQSADCFALASHPTRDGKREGIPVALMEAMACGLPVVASALSGIPELIESGVEGILVPPRDPAALASALEQLAEDADLRGRMGRAGRRRIETEFDLDRNVERLADMFDVRAVRPMRPWESPTLPSIPAHAT